MPLPRFEMVMLIAPRDGPGEPALTLPLDSDRTFNSGDRFRIEYSSIHSGYLYLFNMDEGGTLRLLIPDSRINAGDNRITGSALLSAPTDNWFRFDQRPGIEKLIVLHAIEPLKYLEDLNSEQDGTIGGFDMEALFDRLDPVTGTLDSPLEEGVVPVLSEGRVTAFRTKLGGINVLATSFLLRHVTNETN